MADGRFAILDPAAGVSGDMMLGALVAAGAPVDWLLALPARLGLTGVTVAVEPVDRCGIRAVKVRVLLPGGTQELPAEPLGAAAVSQTDTTHVHAHGHHHAPHRHADDHAGSHLGDAADPLSHPHEHQGAHRHIGELIALVDGAPLSPWVRERAVRAFRLLGEAEGRVHGVPADEVTLHEVGALDALVDIVGSIEGFERLGISQVYHRPVGLGGGWIRAAHGVLPVPAPATAILLEGLEVTTAGPVTGEAVTPTGAVLLRVLSAGPPPGRWRAVSAGAWGAGGRDPEHYPNALRLIIAEPVAESGDVVVLASDLDDLNPEYLDPLREALTAAGALDVQVWATQMKKGRTGFRVETVVPAADADRVADAFFRHSTTAGIRRYQAERVTLSRREVEVEAADGTRVRVKVLDAPDGPRIKPEYDDVAALARRTGQPAHEVARDLRDRAIRLVSSEGAARPKTRTRSRDE